MIKFEDVSKSYTGKHGCMCGCIGTYQIASHYGVEAANKDVGYDGFGMCGDRTVKSTIAKINELIDWNSPADVAKHVTDEWAYYHTATRNYVVYFMPRVKTVAVDAAEALALVWLLESRINDLYESISSDSHTEVMEAELRMLEGLRSKLETPAECAARFAED